jgi:hypothetical protein
MTDETYQAQFVVEVFKRAAEAEWTLWRLMRARGEPHADVMAQKRLWAAAQNAADALEAYANMKGQ